MNIVDLVLALIVLLAVISGFFKGFIIGFMELIGWLGTLLLTLLVYPFILRYIENNTDIQSIWTIPLVFFATFVVLRLIIGFFTSLFIGGFSKESHLSLFNRILGIVPGAASGLIYAAILATLLLLVPLSARITEEAQNSKLAQAFAGPVAEVEDRLSPVFDEAINRTVGKMTIAPESEKFVQLPYKTTDVKARPDLEAQMLALVNTERTKHGLKPVEADPEMTRVARKHSADMFARCYFSHQTPEGKSPFDRMKADNVRFLTAGENLALARNLKMAHEGLMNSPGHRANILRPGFGRLGIGILDGGIYGLMVTQNFRN